MFDVAPPQVEPAPVTSAAAPLPAQAPAIPEPARVKPPPSGAVVAHGGGMVTRETQRRFADLCDHGTLVLIPSASWRAERRGYRRHLARRYERKGFAEVHVLHTDERDVADDPAFVRPLRQADCVWLGGGAQGRLIERYVGTRVEDELHQVVRRGGVVGGSSAGTAILTEIMIRRGNPEPVEGTGFGLIPRVIVDQHFVAAHREPRLLAMLERHPDLVGFGVDEDTALLVSGGRYEVLGDSVVRRCTHANGCTDLLPGDSGPLASRR